MKTLEEKKLLVKMAKMLGEPVDPALLESIEREEKFAAILFKEETQSEPDVEPIVEEITIEEPKVLIEAEPPPPEPAFVPPVKDVVQQTVNILNTAVTANANANVYFNRDVDILKRQIGEIMQKITSLSWGGGGTGIVRLFDADDFDRATVGEGKYMKFQNGWFVLDEINPYEIIHNTTLVTTNTYTVVDSDYYIGVNYAGPVTITIPATISSGREVVIKDESGNCETYNITVNAKVDNDANGFILAVNNGAIHMLYRGDSWRII